MPYAGNCASTRSTSAVAALRAEIEDSGAFTLQAARQVGAQLALRAEQPRAHGGWIQLEALRRLAHVEAFDHAQHEHHAEVFRQRIDGMFEQRPGVRRLDELLRGGRLMGGRLHRRQCLVADVVQRDRIGPRSRRRIISASLSATRVSQELKRPVGL
jgi:hypothetical protein